MRAQHIALVRFVCWLAGFLRQGLCRPGWSSAQRFSCLFLLIAGNSAPPCLAQSLMHPALSWIIAILMSDIYIEWNTSAMPSAFAVFVVNCAALLPDQKLPSEFHMRVPLSSQVPQISLSSCNSPWLKFTRAMYSAEKFYHVVK